ncbi:uncharacterized protein L201_004381 [Kwoniella dendrophila CBS 6074]|uniref:Uncharacterized protein n=1 Tax=Kwoniella dendrophila CBS 6074 TaxID=1295534 RepID=A0AAX4JXP7_9TREE
MGTQTSLYQSDTSSYFGSSRGATNTKSDKPIQDDGLSAALTGVTDIEARKKIVDRYYGENAIDRFKEADIRTFTYEKGSITTTVKFYSEKDDENKDKYFFEYSNINGGGTFSDKTIEDIRNDENGLGPAFSVAFENYLRNETQASGSSVGSDTNLTISDCDSDQISNRA